jgi:bifunctional DNase/RNase
LAACIEPDKEVPSVTRSTATTWVEAEVSEVRRAAGDDPTVRTHAAVLREISGSRRVPIYMGSPEAVVLACSLEAVEMPRPMTYQLVASLLAAAGSHTTEVRITRLADSTFYAVVVIDGPVGRAEVEARPSDALNLALVCGDPIRVDAAVIDNARPSDTPSGSSSPPEHRTWPPRCATAKPPCSPSWQETGTPSRPTRASSSEKTPR